jgi:hypothetical protein
LKLESVASAERRPPDIAYGPKPVSTSVVRPKTDAQSPPEPPPSVHSAAPPLVALQPFVPTPKQLAYLAVKRDALLAGQPTTDQALAEKVPCRRPTISEWRRDRRFEAWVQAELRAQVGAEWPSVLTVALRMALAGNRAVCTDILYFPARVLVSLASGGWKAPRP